MEEFLVFLKQFVEALADHGAEYLGTAVATAAVTLLATAGKLIRAKKRAETAEKNEQLARNAFGARDKVDNSIPLDERFAVGLGIKEVRIMNFASTTLLVPDVADTYGMRSSGELAERLEQLVCEENVRVRIIVTAPDSVAAREAVENEKVINVLVPHNARERIFYDAYAALRKKISEGGSFHESYQSGRFVYRLTEVALPYGIFQVIYDDPKKNHIKLDIYSPFITREKERRTIYIYESKSPEDYAYFSESFDRVYNKTLSAEEEAERRDLWLAAEKRETVPK